jgi:hypothetical protein
MKPLKCIGGPNDGQLMTLRVGEKAVPVRSTERLPVCRTVGLSAGTSDTVSYRETLYLVDVVRSDDGDVEYLRPSDWTAARALRHVLGA